MRPVMPTNCAPTEPETNKLAIKRILKGKLIGQQLSLPKKPYPAARSYLAASKKASVSLGPRLSGCLYFFSI